MGKKSKRKAAKAAAVAAGTTSMGGYSNGQLILGPRPDGITCTNEDPNLCAVCSTVMCAKSFELRFCCGTKVCSECHSEDRCAFCKRLNETAQQAVRFARKRAKEGFPWACHLLADIYRKGVPPCLQQSDWEAVRWYEKGASRDHPVSCLRLARLYRQGNGHKKDLENARIMFDKAMHLRAENFIRREFPIFNIGYEIAEELVDAERMEEGLLVLLPLARRGFGEAQCMMCSLFHRVGDLKGATLWATTCSENPRNPLAALCCSVDIGNLSLVRYWYGLVSDSADVRDTKILKTVHDMLCDLRQICAWCQTNLDRSTRKMCKGCKAHCYCSEDCQRAHWNAEENDHRSECQKVMEVKIKVARTKK